MEEALDPARDGVYVYFASKVLAEKAQWQFVKEHPELDVVSSKSHVLRSLYEFWNVLQSTLVSSSALMQIPTPVPSPKRLSAQTI